jgi:hypothetical protein
MPASLMFSFHYYELSVVCHVPIAIASNVRVVRCAPKKSYHVMYESKSICE